MGRKIEILAPGGNIDSIKAAILAGADAVYCGLNKFNARNRAENISFEDLQGLIRLAHKNNCQVFLTLNIIVLDHELPSLFVLLNKLINTQIDGLIIQDLGLLHLLLEHFKSFKIHASTQLTTHNQGQIEFLNKLAVERVNLSRELNISEIENLTSFAHKKNVLTEVFVHGSYCISFSGICYMSSVQNGKSGNRGQCSQPCRDKYQGSSSDVEYPLNLKDNSAYSNLKELSEAGVDSLKIEGRIKDYEYVYTIVDAWRKQVQYFNNKHTLITDNCDLYKVFNRDFSNSFLKGNLNKNMFIDNPRNHSIKQLSIIHNYSTSDEMEQGHLDFYAEKEKFKTEIKNDIDQLDISKIPLEISISGSIGKPLKIILSSPELSFNIFSETLLEVSGTEALSYKSVFKRLRAINDTEYLIKEIDFNFEVDVYLAFKELNSIKKRILFILNGSKKRYSPVVLPTLKKQEQINNKPTLSVAISSFKDIHICDDKSIDVYFKLASSFKNEEERLISFFKKYENLTAWFPSILIADDYLSAIQFLGKIQAKRIVTDNTGIAFNAYKKGIPWIAGPNMNIANSYSLLALKEKFNCSGSFLSNELNKEQISSIKKPENFNLYFSIYHPTLLMTSRLCLFLQVTGCEKHSMDDSCLEQCEKFSSINGLKEQSYFIKKSRGNYNRVYDTETTLNTDIISDMPTVFSSLFIDLTDINPTQSEQLDQLSIVQLFKDHILGDTNSAHKIQTAVQATSNSQYQKGI